MSDNASPATDAAGAERRHEELQARIDLLEEENQRLRAAERREKRVQHRRTAAGLALIGGVSVVGALLFPDAREVLIALAATGLFAAVLTLWVTPERFVSADVGEQVYAAMARNHDAVVEELGLTGNPVYLPRGSDVRLYVPQTAGGEYPSAEALDDTFVVGADATERGLAVTPTGSRLLEVADTDARTVSEQAATLADVIVETFELAAGADADVDRETGRVTWEVTRPLYGAGDRFDHPIVSLFAVGLASTVDAPVRTDVTDEDPLVVTCRWETNADAAEESEESVEE